MQPQQVSTKSFLQRISATQQVIVGTILIVICTIIAFSAQSQADSTRKSTWFGWLFKPLDPFEQSRKPFIRANVRSIAHIPGTQTIVAVGSGGLVLVSKDKGATWEPQIVSITAQEIQSMRNAVIQDSNSRNPAQDTTELKRIDQFDQSRSKESLTAGSQTKERAIPDTMYQYKKMTK